MDGGRRVSELQKTIIQIYQDHYANTDDALSVSELHNRLIDKKFSQSRYILQKQLTELKNQELICIEYCVNNNGKLWGKGYFLTAKGRYFEV
jgi:hypothetical protein